jgi:hypothetical protein
MKGTQIQAALGLQLYDIHNDPWRYQFVHHKLPCKQTEKNHVQSYTFLIFRYFLLSYGIYEHKYIQGSKQIKGYIAQIETGG